MPMQTLQELRSGSASDVRSIPTLLETLLGTTSPTGHVLSVFLDTSPDRVRRSAFLVAFRDVSRVPEDLPASELPVFLAAVEQVRTYLTDTLEPHHSGLAVYASGDPAYFFAVPLPHRPEDEALAVWAADAEVEPLEEIVDDYERVAVVLFDKERARLFTFYLGALEWKDEFQDEVPGKQATGGWYALAQTSYARHHEEHVFRHARRTARALLRLLQTRPFDRLLLAGPPEAIVTLKHVLPGPLRARLAGTLSLEWFASDEEVERATLAEAERIERASELSAVEEMLDAASSEHVVLGVAGTLNALARRRVHVLVLASAFAQTGAECPACGQLVTGGVVCPYCGAPTHPVADLRSRVVQQAMEQDAAVEVVSNEAAERLMEVGGLGAWTRY